MRSQSASTAMMAASFTIGGQIRTGVPGGAARQHVDIDVVGGLDLFQVHLEDCQAAFHVG